MPLRDLCNMLDISVDYDEATQQITLNNRQDVYTLRLNDCQASCNGRQLALMDVPPQERDGVTYLPMRYLGELFTAGNFSGMRPPGGWICNRTGRQQKR